MKKNKLSKSRNYIKVEGIVQGVGFRPFVYNTAIKFNLAGRVKNTSDGVYIDIEGKTSDIRKFIYELKHRHPILCKIDNLYIRHKKLCNYSNFLIEESQVTENGITPISPDIATCDDCFCDIKDTKNKRFGYPFTNCTNCGPRYTIIKKLPYDRPSTTMEEFHMCDSCVKEYKSPANRRFHAQPNACKQCGPGTELLTAEGKIKCKDPIKQAIKFIKRGKIVAVKGLGGFHLACNAKNKQTVDVLRKRKHRPFKPLAVMMKDINTVKKYCHLSFVEQTIISNNKKPILLLKIKEQLLPLNIAPNSNLLGVMLPFTPLHYMLFDQGLEALVMTSANVSGVPMVFTNEDALNKLLNIADYYLIHNRKIHIPIDDTVSRVILNEQRVLRSARGYSPIFLNFKDINDIIACGSHLKNAFAISKSNTIIISPYIGNMENKETRILFNRVLKHFKNMYKINPTVIAYDMHKNYWSSGYIDNKKYCKVPVQHHHAHIASCMGENKLNEKIIGIAFDGLGYGTDGRLWGSEFFVCDYKNFKRVGRMNYVKMPGGDNATKSPWKMAVSYMYKKYKDEIHTNIPHTLKGKNITPLLLLIKKDINSPECSSMGRLFDAVSAIVGFYGENTYEGEAAIYLENIAANGNFGEYDYDFNCIDGIYVINTDKIISGVLKDVNVNLNKSIISKKFHDTIINLTVELCNNIANKYNIYKFVLSGGVFQNKILLTGLYRKLTSLKLKVYTHKLIPCNDNGICFGQLLIANAKTKGDTNVYSSPG